MPHTVSSAPVSTARDSVALGKSVLRQEADALMQLEKQLGPSFAQAVDLLEKVSGRVIVTGMGKSGHVARKIAATLASTGTPAFFVHPAEASHGDLGMITEKDAVIALSNGGNAPELASIIAYTRRFQIPLVGITSRTDSALGKQSDLVLLLPQAAEACPMGLAPTTSTTLMIALGDALAVTLLSRKGFTAHDYREFHPGGSLGKRLLKVEDLMHAGVKLPLARRDTPLSEVILTMTSKGFGCAGVTDDEGKLVGIITDGDLRRHMSPGLMTRTAQQVMTPSPQTIRGDALAEEALALMNRRAHPFTALFVVKDERPVGILHIHDCLRAGVI